VNLHETWTRCVRRSSSAQGKGFAPGVHVLLDAGGKPGRAASDARVLACFSFRFAVPI
jgi:hypothetical protein